MKVAIAGFGVEGEANFQYWSQLGAEIVIFDEKELADAPEGVEVVVGENIFQAIDEYGQFDLVIRTAGLAPRRITTKAKVWSATNEFFAKCPSKNIIGVTGTKGKGTTCSLITEILKTAHKTVHLVGNIGQPALSVLDQIQPEDIVIFELSSFQLWDLEKSPHIAVVLMIEPDHLNVHKDMEDYIAAKANIVKYQTEEDVVVYHPTNKLSQVIAEESDGKKIKYNSDDGSHIIIPAQAAIHKADWISNQVWDEGKDEWVVIEDQLICKTGDVGLIGEHNLENICAAITAAWQYTQDIKAINKAVMSFTGLPHRLEFVAEVEGVKYYDDSFSSAPGALAAAIKSFKQPEILIAGGFDRGLDYTEMTRAIAEQQNLKKVLLIGQTAEKIAENLQREGFEIFDILTEKDMKQIVEKAAGEAESGEVVILSPGCASFDMFKDFKDRGQQFQAAVRGLK